VSTGGVVAVDLSHYQHHPHLQSCWQKNLGLEAVILKTVTKVDMALRPLSPQKRNMSLRRCLNPLRFLVFDSEAADESEKSHVSLTKTVVRPRRATANSELY